jgi:hypothetical protein
MFSFTVELSGVRVPKLLKIPPAISAIVPTAVFPLTVAAMVGSASSYALWPMRPSACLALIRGEKPGGSMKRLILVLGVSVAVLGSGLAVASVLSAGPSPSASADTRQARQGQDNESDDEGIHGGPISRFHAVSGCKLTDVSTLPGNWTHGDYVSAVEALGDSSLVPTAAQSDCGKPMVVVGHMHGPPDFVLQKFEARQRGRAEPETPGS